MKLPITSLCLLLCLHLAHAQEVLLKGVVTQSGSGGPLGGVVVTASGGAGTAITNDLGQYEITLTDGYENVTFSLGGFVSKTVFVGGKTQLDVSLKAKSGSEAVSVGFGSQSKSELTSSVSTITTDDVSPSPLINLEQSNQGKTTGMFVQNSSGKLGQGTKVRIRGGSSLSASNQPLYVVDGVPLTSGNQSNINPTNIAKIEILKDASAAAMYGSRAANGVILITTKSGGNGGVSIDADYQYSMGQSPRKLDLYGPDEYNLQTIEYTLRSLSQDEFITRDRLEEWQSSGSSTINLPNGSSIGMPAFYSELNNDTDWQDEVFRKANSHRANLSLQGGTEKLGFFSSLSYTTQEGILIGNKYNRFNAATSLNSKISERISANLNLNYFYSKDFRLMEDQDLGAPLQAIVLPPSDTYDENDNFQLKVRSLEYNPLTEVNFSDNLGYNNSLVGSLGLKFDLADALTLDVNGGLDYNNFRDELRQGPETRDGALSGRSQLGTSELRNYIFNGWFTFSPEAVGDGKFSAVLGGSYQESNTTSTFRVSNVNSIDQLERLSPEDPILTTIDIPGQASVFVSSFGRLNYNLKDRYILQVSGRMDGSSKFGEANRYGFFPAASGGWNVSNEPFLQDAGPLNFLKVKASYGLVGNTPQGDFLYRTNYFRMRYGQQDGIRLANLANQNLKWETTAQLDLGLDFGFFEDRISGSVNYYKKTTTDLLFPVPVSQTSGFASVLKNVGTMENKGYEFNLSTVNVESGTFSWSTDFNISFNENLVTDLNGANLIVGVNAFLEDQPAGVFYMRKYAGVNTATGEALYETEGGGTTTDWESAPRMVVGDPNPDYFGGLTNSLKFGNFDLSFMFQFVGGADLYWETGEFLANNGILNLNQTSDQAERWYAPGDEADYPVLNPFQENTFPSTRWLQDGSYIRLKTLTFTYNIPEAVTSNWGLNYMSIYIGGTNLLTFTEYEGYDPDVSYFDPLDGIVGQNISRGIDNFTAPQPKIFMTGIKIGL